MKRRILLEQAVAGQREGSDHEHAHQPHEHGDEHRNGGDQSLPIQDFVAKSGMAYQGEADGPPCEHGVHGGGEEPGRQEIPGFDRLPARALGCEQARDAREIYAAECQGKNGRPMDADETEIAQQVLEGMFGRPIVEDLEGNQRR